MGYFFFDFGNLVALWVEYFEFGSFMRGSKGLSGGRYFAENTGGER